MEHKARCSSLVSKEARTRGSSLARSLSEGVFFFADNLGLAGGLLSQKLPPSRVLQPGLSTERSGRRVVIAKTWAKLRRCLANFNGRKIFNQRICQRICWSFPELAVKHLLRQDACCMAIETIAKAQGMARATMKDPTAKSFLFQVSSRNFQHFGSRVTLSFTRQACQMLQDKGSSILPCLSLWKLSCIAPDTGQL